MSKSRVFFRAIVGGYLAYLGAGLIRDSFTSRPDYYVLYIGFGVIFVLIGFWWFVKAAGAIMRHDYIEPGDNLTDEEADTDESAIEEAPKQDETEAAKEEEPGAGGTEAAKEEEPAAGQKDSVIEED